jgi:membrane dipeptidase
MAFPGGPDTGPGLTQAGLDLVRLCDELGIVIDLSHLNEKGFDDVSRVSSAPLVATHSNAHALCDSPRNLTDRQLHMIRERGGMVGFNFATFYLNADGTADTGTGWDVMLRHLDHLIAQVGEDHVGLGSDFDGCVLPDLIGDVTGVPRLFEAMAAHGYGAQLIAKLARENWMNCLERCLK